ncbi:MAG: thioesterase [Cyclobacteriaceae bacterium]|nr:thioesterase [Cyclobacteriaceae bacterium]
MFFRKEPACTREKAGFGFEQMYSRNQFWVLTRLKVVIDSYPRWMDELTLKTWSRGKNGIFYLRDFAIENNHQKPIIKATSSWAALSTKSRKPEVVAQLEERLKTHAGQIALEERLEKLAELQTPVLLRTRIIEFTDIDIVFHVNNVKYIEMIVNSFPKQKLIKNQIYSLEVNYLGEALYNDTVSIYKDDAEAGTEIDMISIVRQADDKEVCRAMIGWKRR